MYNRGRRSVESGHPRQAAERGACRDSVQSGRGEKSATAKELGVVRWRQAQMADKESSAAGTHVQVAVRCRPLNAR